jgi:hypothetical protein
MHAEPPEYPRPVSSPSVAVEKLNFDRSTWMGAAAAACSEGGTVIFVPPLRMAPLIPT